MKKTIMLAVGAAIIFAAGAVFAGLTVKAPAADKAAVEKIVHDYIMQNPMLILTAIDEHQQRTVQERVSGAIGDNSEALYNDPASPVAGNPQGDITVVEFFDYNCGYCKRSLPEIEALMNDDKNLRFVFKEFPILGPSSEEAARWALAAERQGKYLDFHRELMSSRGPVDEALLERIATNLKLDVARLKQDAQSDEVTQAINNNRELAAALSISGTPAFIIGGELVPGAVGASRMKEVVAAERAKK